MTPRDTAESDRRLTRRRQGAFALIAVVCILLAGAAVVTAQQVQQSDDFEDGDSDGWEIDSTYHDISSESVEGDYSLYLESGGQGISTNARWEAGPTLSLEEEFELSATVRPHHVTEDNGTIQFGLIGEEGNAQLIFDQPNGEIRLATSWDESGVTESYADSFNDEWVNVELVSDGEGTVTAKVWEYGTSEPSDPQLSRQFDPVGGATVGGSVGTQESGGTENIRELWIDSVSVQGTRVVDSEELRLDVPKYLPHNESSHYAVEVNQSGTWVDVTDQASITTENDDALTFYPSNNTVVAGENKSINEKVNVTATYEGLTATGSTVVATPTVNNLDLLPAWWSVNALLSDWTVIWILMATLIATAATRMATTFAGIGAFVMAMVMGWIMGDVPDGIMVATTFMGIFIGLNLAANIDYSVR